MKRVALGLVLASVGAVVLVTQWLGELLADAEDAWT